MRIRPSSSLLTGAALLALGGCRARATFGRDEPGETLGTAEGEDDLCLLGLTP